MDNAGTNKVETSGTASDVSDTNFKQSDANTGNSKDGIPGALPENENKSDSAGAVPETPEMAVARRFHNAIIDSGSDLVTADMEIWGDPYFIADSGMGNYNSEPLPGTINLNADGSINHQNGEVDVNVNFRTPVDFSPEGISIENASYIENNLELDDSLEKEKITEEETPKLFSEEDNLIETDLSVEGQDDTNNNEKLFFSLREAYREGIPKSNFSDDQISGSAKLYSILSKIGGKELVGKADVLSPGTFWSK